MGFLSQEFPSNNSFFYTENRLVLILFFKLIHKFKEFELKDFYVVD